MDPYDESDIDKLIQEELDALDLNDDHQYSTDNDDDIDDNQNKTVHVQDEGDLDLLKSNLEQQMRDRLAAFENEVKCNIERYEIDYTEIDELLQKPIGDNINEIQTNVAKECGIDRTELDRIIQSINAEEIPKDLADDSDSSEYEEKKLEIIRQSIHTIDTDKSSEPTPREQEEDPNKKFLDERLAESHRRMFDELALLDQKRKEEEERYAAVLKEQQERLAEEYRRLQEAVDESVRQTYNEKLQFETLHREQELLANERRNKMATIIQAWYRGRRVYHEHHKEIMKRAQPALKAIAKKRKKKAIQLENIQEVKSIEPIIPLPSNDRISSPSPRIIHKESKPIELIVTEEKQILNEQFPKKKKTKPTTTSQLLKTEIVQLENPADFVPTVVPQKRIVSTPRITRIENLDRLTRVSSPKQSQDDRPKSANKRPSSPKIEPMQISAIIKENIHQPVEQNDFVYTPTIIDNPPTARPRSDTFEKTIEHNSTPPPVSPTPPPVERIPLSSMSRSNTFTSKTEISPRITSHPMDIRSNTFINDIDDTKFERENIPVIESPQIDLLPVEITQESNEIRATPRTPTPRKIVVEEPRPMKVMYSFLNEARRWAGHTKDLTYANIVLSTEEHKAARKAVASLRKLPDIDIQLLIRAARNQSANEIFYLFLEQILTPCSLSLIGINYPKLTHLSLRHCKLLQLVGLESCTCLKILDVEGNWLEQIHLQSNSLEYLNVSRNRLTSILSLNTPNLKYLDVSKNRLTRLNGIETLFNLYVLLATSNQLLTTIGLQGCIHLLHIDVSDNHLVEMEQIEQCPLLITIKATSNALIQTPNLLNAILLNELDLSSNSLTSLDELSVGSWLPFITCIRLSNNSLQELPSIKLPSLNQLDLAYNQLSDLSTIKRFIKACPSLSYMNLERNPVLCDIKDSLLTENKSSIQPISVLPQSTNEQTLESIQNYLYFLSNIIPIFIKLRQTIEQYQIEPFQILNSIHEQCQHYREQKFIEIIHKSSEPARPVTPVKILSKEEKSIIRLQAHWRRRSVEKILNRQHRAAQIIQAHWRGYAVRQRIRNVRHLFKQQPYQTFDEIDLSQFDFDEAAFDARLQRPRTPAMRSRQVWQSQYQVLAKPMSVTDLPQLIDTPRSTSTASSLAKPIVEPLPIQSRIHQITNEWGFTPTSTTAALMVKRAERMKWNAEKKHKKEHLDAYQRLQKARQNELPPGTLRLARRQPAIGTIPTKPIAHTQTLSLPSTAQSTSNRAYEWVHTQITRIDDESSVGNPNSPRNERKRLPSLDGSTDSANRIRSNENSQQQQQHRWSSSSVSIRQPPPLLPPINGKFPRS